MMSITDSSRAPTPQRGPSTTPLPTFTRRLKKLFLDSGRDGLAQGRRRRSARESELEAENEELKAALGEAHVQLRVWKRGAEHLPPLRSSR